MSTILSEKKTLSPWAKGGIGLGAGALLLVLVGLLFPTAAAFFPLVSLWCSCVLFYGALWVLHTAGVELDFFHRAAIIAFWAGAVLYFYWALDRRQFIYAWDYVNYIQKQFNTEAAFALGPVAGFKYIISTFSEDYTNFITLFTEFPFCLTAKTGDSYAFAQVFCVLPSLMLMLAGLTIKIGQILEVKNKFWYFLIGFSWVLTYPFLRMSAMLAQPDWFGLIFAFAILLLTLDYRFEKLEPGRFVLIFLATAAIILSRRWYLYFVVGYYFSYALLLFVSSAKLAKQGQKGLALRRVRNLILFGVCAMAAMVVLLWPMVSKILAFNYSDRYSYYNVGGIAVELYYHAMRTGLLNLILILFGLWLCVKRKKPSLPVLALCELMLSMLLFTRVQNSGSHQMLLYVPAYVILFLCGAAGLAESIELTYDRKDKPQIQAMAQWLVEHLGEGEVAYMIPDDMLYNPGHLRNCDLPNHALDGKLPDSFSVPGTHSFPTGFFDARYVVTADPFPLSLAPDTELGHRFNAVFLQLRETTHQQVATFDMGNGTVFTIWERTTPVTREEVETYLHEFDAENAKYPEMFSSVVENWLAVHGL